MLPEGLPFHQFKVFIRVKRTVNWQLWALWEFVAHTYDRMVDFIYIISSTNNMPTLAATFTFQPTLTVFIGFQNFIYRTHVKETLFIIDAVIVHKQNCVWRDRVRRLRYPTASALSFCYFCLILPLLISILFSCLSFSFFLYFFFFLFNFSFLFSS